MKSPIKGKLGPWPISKSQEPQFYTFVLEFGLLKYPAPRHFPNRDNRRTRKVHIIVNVLYKIYI